jgi:MEMO1 family protein
MSQIVRPPAVAGQFYPSDKDELYELIHWSFTSSLGPGKFPTLNYALDIDHNSKFRVVVVPHAGYIYSGPVAAHSYEIVFNFFQEFRNAKDLAVVILGPNHYGLGSGVAISGADFWETPLGRVRVAKDIRKRMISESNIVDIDDLAHSREHSIEVQVPFIQAMAGSNPDRISIVPVSMMLQDIETAREVGETLYSAVRSSETPCLIIGSSDLTHYEPHDIAYRQDHFLLAEVEKINLTSFYAVLERNNISACGYGAIAAVMHLSKKFGLSKGVLLKYATSGDTSGDRSSVVGYSSVHFTK